MFVYSESLLKAALIRLNFQQLHLVDINHNCSYRDYLFVNNSKKTSLKSGYLQKNKNFIIMT